MKRFVFLLTTIFMCTITCAETFYQYWFVENNTPIQTTCETGGDIILPTAPTKYGYDFIGWEKVPIKRIEYLEMGRGPVVDTGYIPSNKTRILAKFQPTSVENNYANFFGIFPNGSHGSNQSYEFFVWGKTYTYVWSGSKFTVSSAAPNDVIVLDWNRNVLNITKNGVTRTNTFTVKTFTAPYSLPIFALRSSDAFPEGGSFQGKFYYFQIYDNDVLVRDYIPVLDGNGTPCMYDKVEKKFYYNAGTEQFVAGPVIGE